MDPTARAMSEDCRPAVAARDQLDSTVASVADGVKLELLKGLNGGIVVELAHAESAAGGTRAVVTPESPPVKSCPHRGDEPVPPLGAGLLPGAVIVRQLASAGPRVDDLR